MCRRYPNTSTLSSDASAVVRVILADITSGRPKADLGYFYWPRVPVLSRAGYLPKLICFVEQKRTSLPPVVSAISRVTASVSTNSMLKLIDFR